MLFEKRTQWSDRDHHVLFVLHGTITVQFRTHSIRFKEGECYTIEKGSFVERIQVEEGAEYALYAFQFIGEEEVLRWPIIRFPQQLLIDALQELERVRKERNVLLFQQKLFEFLHDIHARKDKRNRQCIHQMEPIREYVDDYFTTNLSLQQVADHFFMSPNHLNELFKQRFGMTLMAYVTERRITMAKFLLARNVYRVRDIAHKVGYEDEFYFSRKFKHETGYTPTQFARMAKHDPAYEMQLM